MIGIVVENLSLGQLTKEMIVSRLKDTEDAPAIVADIVKKTILASFPSVKTGSGDARTAIEDICFGAMSGLLLIEKNLPRSAVLILAGMAEISQKIGVDPSELMTWSMEGIARIAPLTTPQIMEDTRTGIEREYMGAGEIFAGLCDKFRAQKK